MGANEVHVWARASKMHSYRVVMLATVPGILLPTFSQGPICWPGSPPQNLYILLLLTNQKTPQPLMCLLEEESAVRMKNSWAADLTTYGKIDSDQHNTRAFSGACRKRRRDPATASAARSVTIAGRSRRQRMPESTETLHVLEDVVVRLECVGEVSFHRQHSPTTAGAVYSIALRRVTDRGEEELSLN